LLSTRLCERRLAAHGDVAQARRDVDQRLERLVTGCPSWDGPRGALADTAASVAGEHRVELDPDQAGGVLGEVPGQRTGGGRS
jgi:hypothetical protein